MTPQEFDAMVGRFLQTLDDSESHERWDSTRDQAGDILSQLRSHLFAEEIAKEKRRLLYLGLKAEFEPDRVLKTLSEVQASNQQPPKPSARCPPQV